MLQYMYQQVYCILGCTTTQTDKKKLIFAHLGRETAQKRLRNGWRHGFSEPSAVRADGARGDGSGIYYNL